jgi:hypothetical protein
MQPRNESSQKAYWLRTLLSASYGTLSELPNISVPQFPHLCDGYSNRIYLVRMKCIDTREKLKIWLIVSAQ